MNQYLMLPRKAKHGSGEDQAEEQVACLSKQSQYHLKENKHPDIQQLYIPNI